MLALLGGTFDPIHLGHLDLARRIGDTFGFSEVAFVPARRNPLKRDEPRATAAERLEMVRLALEDTADPRFSVVDSEVLSPGPSYTILTVGKCLAQGRGPVTLVMGNEVFRTLDAWKQPERLLELADIIVVTRDTLGEGDIPMVLGTLGIGGRWESPERFVHGERGRAVTVFPITPLPYAATPIRAAWAHYWQGAATGPTPQGVSPRVQDFIKKNRLYAVT